MGTTIDVAGWPRRGEEGPAIVALGGGHGLSATLRALRHVTHRLTAVVTVADDGGSSGRLRREFDCLPPGDLRMALAFALVFRAPDRTLTDEECSVGRLAAAELAAERFGAHMRA